MGRQLVFKRRGVLVGVVVLALIVMAVVVVRSLVVEASRSQLDTALRMTPAKALRVGFTDWSDVRRITGVPLTRDATKLSRLVEAAYDRDLSAASGLGEAAVAMQRHLGFSPGVLDWEVLAQARAGAAEVMRLDDSIDLDDVRAALKSTGFKKPKADDGVWRGGVDLLDGLDQTLDSGLQFAVVLDEEHLVVTSEDEDYVKVAARAARGDLESLADADDTDALTASAADPVVSAMLWSRDFVCEDLAMTDATEEDQTRAERLIRQAGGLGPLTGLLMARPAASHLVVVARYESGDRARRDLKARAELAVGEAVGRGGSFPDEYRLTASRTDDANVVLDFEAASGNTFLLSSLNHGPVLFAAC